MSRRKDRVLCSWFFWSPPSRLHWSMIWIAICDYSSWDRHCLKKWSHLGAYERFFIKRGLVKLQWQFILGSFQTWASSLSSLSHCVALSSAHQLTEPQFPYISVSALQVGWGLVTMAESSTAPGTSGCFLNNSYHFTLHIFDIFSFYKRVWQFEI